MRLLGREIAEPELSALCFDPVPGVIHAVLENTRAGLPVDGKTAALLCARDRSPLLIQNLTRWTAAPPALIAHLLKQEAVTGSDHEDARGAVIAFTSNE